jgi:hypothetical protein
MTNGNALAVLQAKLAENAADLIQHGFVGLKELVVMIQSLETTQKDDDDGNVEQRLQRFLRGENVDPPAMPTAKRAIQ